MNRGTFLLLSAVAASVLLTSFAAPARAACNLSPDASMIFAKGERAAPPDGLPYRGRVGRIGRALFVPGVTEYFDVGADPVCKSPPLATVMRSSAEIAALLLYQRDDGGLVHAHLIGSAILCARTKAVLQAAGLTVSCASGAGDLVVLNDGRVRLAYPSPSDVTNADGRMLTGPFSVLAFGVGGRGVRGTSNRDDSVELVAQQLSASTTFAQGVCAVVASTAADFLKTYNGFVCVDEIYRDPGDEACDVNDVSITRVGPTYRNIGMGQVLSLSTPVDFAKECQSGNGCLGESTALPYKFTADGELIIPFNFATIIANGARPLEGSSAFRRSDTMNAAIYLPGPEFVGSVPLGTHAPSKNPAKPEIYIGDKSNDVVLHLKDANVDKPNAAVTLYARKLVSVACEDGTACQCYDVRTDVETKACAVGNDCKPLASPECHEIPPTYFQCVGANARYEYTGLPCTRDNHCPGSGSCQPAVCVAKDKVWEKNLRAPANPTPCGENGSCPAGEQCGLSLFVAPQGEDRRHPHEIDTNDPRRRGACESTRNRTSCTTKLCAVSDACIGYHLGAN